MITHAASSMGTDDHKTYVGLLAFRLASAALRRRLGRGMTHDAGGLKRQQLACGVGPKSVRMLYACLELRSVSFFSRLARALLVLDPGLLGVVVVFGLLLVIDLLLFCEQLEFSSERIDAFRATLSHSSFE